MEILKEIVKTTESKSIESYDKMEKFIQRFKRIGVFYGKVHSLRASVLTI